MEEDQGILSYHLDRLWRKYFSEVLTTSMQSCSVPLKRNHFVVVVCLFVCQSEDDDEALLELYEKADAMMEHVSNITDAASDLQAGLDQQSLYTELLKENFESFKEA